MRLKSKYRRAFRDGGRVDLPGQTQLPRPIEPESPATPQPEPPQPQAAEKPAEPPQQSEQPPQPQAPPQPSEDSASIALQRQIESLRRSEQIQRQQHEAMVGVEVRRRAWLAGNPKAQQNIEALGLIHHAALQAGLPDTSPEYFSFVEQQLAALPEASDMPTPKFFQPPAAAKPSAPKVIHSAP